MIEISSKNSDELKRVRRKEKALEKENRQNDRTYAVWDMATPWHLA